MDTRMLLRITGMFAALSACLASRPAAAQGTYEPPGAGSHTPTASTPPAPETIPPLKVIGSSATQNVGVRSPLELVTGQFTLRNESDKPLTVTKVEAGCRCTFGVVNPTTIPPRSNAVLNYEIDVRGTLGELRKPIMIRCAGYPTAIQVLVQGELQYAVRVENPRPTPGMTGEATMKLISSDGTPFRVLSVAGEPPRIVASDPPNAEKALSWTFEYNLHKDMVYAVVVETDHPKAPVIDIRSFSGSVSELETPYFKVVNDLAIGRHMVNLGVVKPGDSAEFDMYITRVKDYEQPVEVRTDGGKVKLELVKTFPWRRPDDTGLQIRAKFSEMAKGTLLFPVYVTSNGKTNRTWACAVVRP